MSWHSVADAVPHRVPRRRSALAAALLHPDDLSGQVLRLRVGAMEDRRPEAVGLSTQ